MPCQHSGSLFGCKKESHDCFFVFITCTYINIFKLKTFYFTTNIYNKYHTFTFKRKQHYYTYITYILHILL